MGGNLGFPGVRGRHAGEGPRVKGPSTGLTGKLEVVIAVRAPKERRYE